MKHGKDLVMSDIIKTLFTYVKGEDIDYLTEKKILTSDQLSVADSGSLNVSAQYILNLIVAGLPLLKLVPAAVRCFKTLPLVSFVCGAIPKDFDEEKVGRWIRRYRAL